MDSSKWNCSPQLQERMMYEERISELSEELKKRKEMSLISIIKERFNNWFFGTKG